MRISTPGNSKYQRLGFTLVELVVVMVLIVLLAGMMTPSLVSFYAESQLRSGLRQFLAHCHYARDQAVSRNTAVRVNWEIEERTHFITVEQALEESSEETEFVPEQTDLGGIKTLPPGVNYAGILVKGSRAEKPSFVTFTPDGRAEEMAILFENTRGTRRAVAIEAISGRCRVVEVEELEKAGFRVR